MFDRERIRAAMEIIGSWWFAGIVGWIIVISNYPVAGGIPHYAG